MCLAVPGKIKHIFNQDETRMGLVDFSGVEMDVCLEAVPEALEGDYVIVHAGFAISVLTDIEAQETLDIFKQLDEIQSQLDENQ